MKPSLMCISLALENPGSAYNTCWNALVDLKYTKQRELQPENLSRDQGKSECEDKSDIHVPALPASA